MPFRFNGLQDAKLLDCSIVGRTGQGLDQLIPPVGHHFE